MKVLRFIFKDFGRKLVALIFAVAIYFQLSRTIKKQEMPREVPNAAAEVAESSEPVEKSFAVQVLGSGSGRRIVFSEGDEPDVTAVLRGNVDDLKDGDLRFYIEAEDDLTPGTHKLKVYYHIRRPDIHVQSFEPGEMEISVMENPDNSR